MEKHFSNKGGGLCMVKVPRCRVLKGNTCTALTEDLSLILKTYFRRLAATNDFSSRESYTSWDTYTPTHICAHIILKSKRDTCNVIQMCPVIRHLHTLIFSGVLFDFRF